MARIYEHGTQICNKGCLCYECMAARNLYSVLLLLSVGQAAESESLFFYFRAFS